MTKNYKSPINWFGGKYYMANSIIEMFPNHKTYVEVFGGAGHILFKKKPSEIEVYNDIYSDLYNFFRIIRDEEKSKRLIKKIQLTPYSRKEFLYCRDNWENEIDEIEKIRMWYVSAMQSFSTNFSTWSHSKSVSRRGMSQAVSKWLGNVDENLPLAIERLRQVQIENMDCNKLIEKYSGKDTLFYLDPPYVHETREMTYKYQHEMTNDMHINLVKTLLSSDGMFIMSGYNTEVYNPLLANGWNKKSIGKYEKRSEKSNGSNSRSSGEEILWYKI